MDFDTNKAINMLPKCFTGPFYEVDRTRPGVLRCKTNMDGEEYEIAFINKEVFNDGRTTKSYALSYTVKETKSNKEIIFRDI